jgi:membrane associated rhomboid family serine protease
MFPIRDHERPSGFPFVTIILIAINVIVFYFEFTAPDTEAFIREWALVPSALDFSSPGSLLRLITSQFLHGGFAHIGFNMWYLWIFGDNVELHIGHFKYLLFYLLAGIAAGLAQLIFSIGSDIPMLGASGAIAGVLGGYLALFPRHRVDTLLPTPVGLIWSTLPAGVVLFLWFGTQLLNGTASITSVGGGVAWWAHIGGFAFGWIVAKLLFRKYADQPQTATVG